MKRNIVMMILAAGAFMFTGCNETPAPSPVDKDAVSIAPGEEIFENTGGTLDVIVTSSGTWTLSGEYDWVTPSVKSGKDGDIVKFVVVANNSETQKVAEFKFTVNKEEAKLKLTVKGKSPDPVTKLTLLSDAAVTIPKEATRVEIELDTDLNYRDLEHNIAEIGRDWLTYVVTTKVDGAVKMYFDAAANTTFEGRSAEITISGGDANVKVVVSQAQTNRIEMGETNFIVALAGEVIEIPVTANVDYAVTIAESAKSWITHNGKTGDKEKFTVSAGDITRRGEIIFSYESLSVTVTFVQKGNSIINTAVDMTSNRTWPEWTDATPVTNMEAFTLEALVYADVWRTRNLLNTIMGIEGKFLVRTGDVGVNNNQIQVCYERKNSYGNASEGKLSNASMTLEAKKWNHIAITFDKATKTVKCYINGEEKGSVTESASYSIDAVNFGIPHSNETGTVITRCFWIGYAYEHARYWPGMMSEVRIWNKVLTPTELTAENHPYTVAPSSEGLVAYWKFNENGGTVVKDYTSYGNDMTSDKELKGEIVSLPN